MVPIGRNGRGNGGCAFGGGEGGRNMHFMVLKKLLGGNTKSSANSGIIVFFSQRKGREKNGNAGEGWEGERHNKDTQIMRRKKKIARFIASILLSLFPHPRIDLRRRTFVGAS